MTCSMKAFECWLLVWVLLDTTTLNLCSAACTGPQGETGDITVSSKSAVTSGYILICDGMEWRAVCHREWDLEDAMVVCRQLGFDPQAIQRTTHCANNCYGSTKRFNGLNDVECIGNETRLIDCPANRTDNMDCYYAGVTCGAMTHPLPDCPQTTLPTSPLPLTETPPSCQAIGGALGALASGLGLALVGVVMGWVWHCHRNKGKSNPKSPALPPVMPLYETPDTIMNPALQPRPSTEQGGVVMASNPSYATSGSASRPRPSPRSHAPPWSKRESIT